MQTPYTTFAIASHFSQSTPPITQSVSRETISRFAFLRTSWENAEYNFLLHFPPNLFMPQTLLCG